MSYGIALNTLCNQDSRFIYDVTTGLWRQVSVVDEGELRFTLPPFGAKIDEIQAIVKGAPGHSGLPGSMPTIVLHQLDNGVLSDPPLEIEEDDDAQSVASYQDWHSIVMAVGSREGAAADGDRTYKVSFTGETDGNSEAGLTLAHIHVTLV